MYDDLLIRIDTWNSEEWDKILTHVDYYCGDYEEDEDGNILVHCESETEYWELYDFLHKLGQ